MLHKSCKSGDNIFDGVPRLSWLHPLGGLVPIGSGYTIHLLTKRMFPAGMGCEFLTVRVHIELARGARSVQCSLN